MFLEGGEDSKAGDKNAGKRKQASFAGEADGTHATAAVAAQLASLDEQVLRAAMQRRDPPELNIQRQGVAALLSDVVPDGPSLDDIKFSLHLEKLLEVAQQSAKPGSRLCC